MYPWCSSSAAAIAGAAQLTAGLVLDLAGRHAGTLAVRHSPAAAGVAKRSRGPIAVCCLDGRVHRADRWSKLGNGVGNQQEEVLHLGAFDVLPPQPGSTPAAGTTSAAIDERGDRRGAGTAGAASSATVGGELARLHAAASIAEPRRITGRLNTTARSGVRATAAQRTLHACISE